MNIAPDILRSSAPSPYGSGNYIDHTECGDTRHRLWIKRNVDGSIVGYCHNCGSRGYLRKAPFVATDPPVRDWAVKPPIPDADLVRGPEFWPNHARGWLLKYGIEPWELPGVGWWPKGDRLALPVRDFGNALVGHNMRSTDGREPKYLFQGQSSVGHWVRDKDGPLIIVEDILSATKVGRQFDSVALLRTHMSPAVLAKVQKYAHVLIWMDPDRAGWEASAKLVDKLAMFTDAIILHTEEQPKEATDERIKTVVSDNC